MRTLRELMPKKNLFDHQGKGLIVDEKTIFYICKKILVEEYGSKGAENILPTFYKDKKLFLTPRSSLWANEVWLQRNNLLERINEALGSEAILEVKVTQEN